MVSRVYQHYMQPYPRLNGGGGGSAGTTPVAAEEKRPSNPGGQGFNNQQQSRGLATIAEQSRQSKIQLSTILQDFRSTMDALGADEDVQAEVDAYLNVVALQSRKETPAVPFIRQTLKTAADSLDGFISGALNQPSRVVRDWVEALLLQNIDYKDSNTVHAIAGAAASLLEPKSTSPGGTTSVEDSVSASLNPEEKQQLKEWMRQGRELSKEGQVSEALAHYRQAAALLEGRDRPDLEGRVAQLSGRAYEKAKRYDEALSAYSHAADQYGKSGQQLKQAQVAYAQAGIYDVRGELPQAQIHYEKALALVQQMGGTRHESRILNDLGVLYLRRHQNGPALETLRRAVDVAEGSGGDQALLPDIYSNLGALYRLQRQYKQSAGAYRRSLDAAHRLKDKRAYYGTLLNFAELYDEAGRSEKAAAMREKAQQLGVA